MNPTPKSAREGIAALRGAPAYVRLRWLSVWACSSLAVIARAPNNERLVKESLVLASSVGRTVAALAAGDIDAALAAFDEGDAVIEMWERARLGGNLDAKEDQ